MPYSSAADLPPEVKKHLPPHARGIFVSAFNAAYGKYGEETAFKIAWAAVHRKYRKGMSGMWVPK